MHRNISNKQKNSSNAKNSLKIIVQMKKWQKNSANEQKKVQMKKKVQMNIKIVQMK